MRVICASEINLPPPTGAYGPLLFSLYQRPNQAGIGSAGTSLVEPIRKLGLSPSVRAWDFLSIALAVLCADEGCSRLSSPDGWTREIELDVEVVDRDFWASTKEMLELALRFLTGDVWKISFLQNNNLPGFSETCSAQSADSVSMLSGGVDSLVGAIDLVVKGLKPIFVSQVAKGDKEVQRSIANSVAGGLHLQLNHLVRPFGPSERSQRARSMIFIAYGLIAATSLDRYKEGGSIDLFMPENGYISLNVPLTSLRLGSLSTRTTHPVFLGRVQRILDLAQIRVRIVNPYQFKTKGEMLVACENQDVLAEYVFKATSCGRFARNGFIHCGRCVPCLIRRAAILKWGVRDETSYRYDDLSIAGPKYRNFDDVRSAGMAVEQVRRSSVYKWVGGTLNSAELGDVTQYLDVAGRGISELGAFLRHVGAL